MPIGNLLRRQNDLWPTQRSGSAISDKRSGTSVAKSGVISCVQNGAASPATAGCRVSFIQECHASSAARVCLHLPSELQLSATSFLPLPIRVLLGGLFEGDDSTGSGSCCLVGRSSFLLRSLVLAVTSSTPWVRSAPAGVATVKARRWPLLARLSIARPHHFLVAVPDLPAPLNRSHRESAGDASVAPLIPHFVLKS